MRINDRAVRCSTWNFLTFDMRFVTAKIINNIQLSLTRRNKTDK